MAKDNIFSSLNNLTPDLTIGSEGKGTPPKPALGSGDMLSLVRELLGFRQGDPGWMTTEERRAARKDNPIYADLMGIGSHRARDPRQGVVEDPGSFRGIKTSDYDAKKIEDKAASRGMSVEDYTKSIAFPTSGDVMARNKSASAEAETAHQAGWQETTARRAEVFEGLKGGSWDNGGERLTVVNPETGDASYYDKSGKQTGTRTAKGDVVEITDASGKVVGTSKFQDSPDIRKALASGDISAIEAATKAARKPQDQVAKALGLPPASFISRLTASNAY